MKLLVTTDFSANSKGGNRFTQNLSSQTENIEVISCHDIHIMKPVVWSDVFFKAYKNGEVARLTADLKKFIQATIGKEKGKFFNVKFVVENCITTEKDILKYVEKNKIDFICINTLGAGMVRKVTGIHNTRIVNNSKVPVMVIQTNY